MPLLAIWTPEDGLLGALAPLGLAASAGTALVVDLDPRGPRYPGSATLASLVEDGPRRADLTPQRRGVAVLGNGGIEAAGAGEVVEALCRGWPAVVLRLPPRPYPEGAPAPVVPVRPLLPGSLFGHDGRAAVFQSAGWQVPQPAPGPTLPRLRPRTVDALLNGRLPARDRWIRAWKQVWRWPWA